MNPSLSSQLLRWVLLSMLAVYASRYRFASECHPRHSSISLSARKTENMHAQASLDCMFSVFLLPEMPVSGSKDDETTNCGVSRDESAPAG